MASGKETAEKKEYKARHNKYEWTEWSCRKSIFIQEVNKYVEWIVNTDGGRRSKKQAHGKKTKYSKKLQEASNDGINNYNSMTILYVKWFEQDILWYWLFSEDSCRAELDIVSHKYAISTRLASNEGNVYRVHGLESKVTCLESEQRRLGTTSGS